VLLGAECGGVELFRGERFGFRIASPEEFVPSNPLLWGKFYLKHKAEYDADRSAAWFLAARGLDSPEAVVLDLSPERRGRCYDGFWDVYATGNSQVVAGSFTELIERLYAARGTSPFWERSDFDLGQAYD
jgi:antitoxin YokJ